MRRHGLSHAWPHRSQGQPALPRRDDVRRVGQPRPRRLRSASSTARSTPASTSSTPPTSTRAGESEEIVGKALAGGRRDDVVLATKVHGTDGRRPQPARQLAPLDHARGREQPAPAGHRLHRPVPDPPPRADTDIDETLGALTDLVRAGQGPLLRLLDVPGPADRRGAVGGASGAAASGSCASSRRTRSSPAAIEHDVLPTCAALRHGRDPVEPARRRLAVGPLPQGRRAAGARVARERIPTRYDMSPAGQPAQARRRRRAGRAGRGGRHHADRAGARVRASAIRR